MTPKKMPPSIQRPTNPSIDRAWRVISTEWIDYNSIQYNDAYEIISNWRYLHTYPLNTFQVTLRDKANKIWLTKDEYFISQRLKRIFSIVNKLKRNPTTQLSRMQDIWWIRIVLPNIDYVKSLKEIYIKEFKSKLYLLKRHKDYIDEPKESWYRSVHLIFEYHNTNRSLDLLFEFQIRTLLQHARATAVETIWTYIWHSLKSSEGPEERNRYFKYVSVGLSYLEWTKIHNDFFDKSPKEVIEEIQRMTKNLKVKDLIKWFSRATQAIDREIRKAKKWDDIFVIKLDTTNQDLYIYSFSSNVKAKAIYKLLEKEALENVSISVVLVSIDNIKNLTKAYPSYMWHNKIFLEALEQLEKYWS